MLGFVSRFGSSKGMIAVPDFSGVATATAEAQVVSVGLRNSAAGGIRNTNVLAQDGVSVAQLPPAGTLVDYETEVIITSGNYIADTVNVGPCQNYGTTTNDPDSCSGKLYVYGSARTKRRKTVTTTNNVTGQTTTTFDNTCTDDVVSRGNGYIDGQCGYVAPPTTCTATTKYGAYTACDAAFALSSSGTKNRNVSGTNTDCSTFSYTQYTACCQAVCGAWSPWSTVPSDTNKEQRSRTCQATDCTTTLERDSRCKTNTVTTYGGCGSKKTRIRTTKVYNLCDGSLISSSSATISCNAV